ncbi:MAG: MraY family glycosyltransferase, partial [Clostridia bacterium]|nr:MraY family glycosyltransferase [Clostridia bacterium]
MTNAYILIAISLFASIVIAYVLTPVAMWAAKKIGAVDVPGDNRRMHTHPIPRLGGLAIIAAFLITALIVIHDSRVLLQILPGAIIIGILGVLDDKYRLPAWPKLLVQCIAAALAVAQGAQITRISGIQLFGISWFNLGFLVIPITIIWIVGITNAVNFIDGLDGL